MENQPHPWSQPPPSRQRWILRLPPPLLLLLIVVVVFVVVLVFTVAAVTVGLPTAGDPERRQQQQQQQTQARTMQECSSISEILCETSVLEHFCELWMLSGNGNGNHDDDESASTPSSSSSPPSSFLDDDSVWTVFAPTNGALEEVLDTMRIRMEMQMANNNNPATDFNSSANHHNHHNDTENFFPNDEWEEEADDYGYDDRDSYDSDDSVYDYIYDRVRDEGDGFVVDLWSDDLLGFHTIRNRVLRSNNLACHDRLVMSNGKTTTIGCRDYGSSNNNNNRIHDGLFIAGSGNTDADHRPRIVVTDVVACNGIIHVIDGVLMESSGGNGGSNDQANIDNENENDTNHHGIESAGAAMAPTSSPKAGTSTSTTRTEVGEPDPKPHDRDGAVEDCQSIRKLFSKGNG